MSHIEKSAFGADNSGADQHAHLHNLISTIIKAAVTVTICRYLSLIAEEDIMAVFHVKNISLDLILSKRNKKRVKG